MDSTQLVIKRENVRRAFRPIYNNLKTFVKDIVIDTVTNPDNYFVRLEISEGFFKVLIHNRETTQIVGKGYDMESFLLDLVNKRVETILNIDVKRLIQESDKPKKDNKKVRWIV